MTTRQEAREAKATEVLDAIRLTIEAAGSDRAAVMVIRTILADGPAPNPKGDASVHRLLRAIKRTRNARLALK